MTTHDEDLRELGKLLCIRDQDGRPAILTGLVVTVFFENGWTRPVREIVSELGERYYALFREQLRWTQHPTSARIYPITSKRVKHHTEWLPGHEADHSSHRGLPALSRASSRAAAGVT
jgi:hypothetical protein